MTTTRTLASFFALAALTLGPTAAFAEVHGGAVPHNLSFYEAAEFTDVQWAAGAEAAPSWGSLVLEGDSGVRFVPDNGQEVKVPYSWITRIKYERVVKQKEKAASQKWFHRTLAFAKGVDTYRAITIEHFNGTERATSTLRVDGESATGIIRVLEIKTGLRVKKLSNL